MIENVKQSLILKHDLRVHASAEHVDSFTSAITHPGKHALLEITELALKPGASTVIDRLDQSAIVLPLVGGITVKQGDRIEILNPEQLMFCAAGPKLVLENKHQQRSSLVVFYFKYACKSSHPQILNIGINTYNELISLQSPSSIPEVLAGLGIFRSRSKLTYTCQQSNAQLLAFIINGSFEIEGRLVEYRDSLLFWDKTDIELEALAEDSIICILELTDYNTL